jgi:uncharacterized membrane protein YiaA
MDNVLLYVATVLPSFVPIFLFMLALVITLGTYFGSRRLGEEGDFFASATVGTFITTILAYFMTLKEGLINLPTLVTCFVITLICFIMLFVTRGR